MAVLGSDNISHSGDFKINVNSADRVTITTTGKIQASAGTNWVGTVSQSGTSAVIEQGSNANGEYVKFADGTLMCVNEGTTTLTSNATAIRYNWTYPSAFISTPRKMATERYDSGLSGFVNVNSNKRDNMVGPLYEGIGGTITQVLAYDNNVQFTAGDSMRFNLFAVGRWY
jgi:hypothetical protein